MPTTKTKTIKAKAGAAAQTLTAKKIKTATPTLGDRPDTLDMIHRAMVSGAKKAVEENDRLGIPTPGAKDGKIVYRTPPKAKKPEVG